MEIGRPLEAALDVSRCKPKGWRAKGERAATRTSSARRKRHLKQEIDAARARLAG